MYTSWRVWTNAYTCETITIIKVIDMSITFKVSLCPCFTTDMQLCFVFHLYLDKIVKKRFIRFSWWEGIKESTCPLTHTEVIPWNWELFPGIVTETEGDVLVWEVDPSGGRELSPVGKSQIQSDEGINSSYWISLLILQFAFLRTCENCFLWNHRIHTIIH